MAGLITQRDALFSPGSSTRALYEALLKAVARIGPYDEKVNKTSVHLVRGSAFAGVHPRKDSLLMTIKSTAPLHASRVVKSEQVSKNRWHVDVRVTEASDIDAELLGWVRTAYELCA
jgi:hypothetical protein